MIDNLAILFSTSLVVVVIYRAVRLDAVEPWFKPRPQPAPDGAQPHAPPPPWRRR